MPSADAGTAFSASSAETDRPAPSTEAPAPAEATRPSTETPASDETARPRAEVPSVDKSGLESAYTRLQGLLQQAPDLSDKTADSVASYRQARQEAESLAQQALTALSSQTVSADEVAQLQAQLVASSNKLEASMAGLQVASKPVATPSATVEEKAVDPAPVGKAPETSNENASGATITSPRESTAKAEESAPARPEASPAIDNAKPETATIGYDVTRPQTLAKATDERSVVPTTRFKRNLVEREATTPVADQMTVEYLDKDGKKLNLNDVLQGGDGTNIPLKVRVTVPSTSTQTQVKLTLAPFMRFVSTGDQDEGVQKTTIDVSKPVDTIDIGKSWKAPNGDDYYNQLRYQRPEDYNKPLTYQTGQSVTYRLKENVKVVEIPLVLSVDRILGLKGYSPDGQLPGVSEGVEKATPVTTTLTTVVGTTKETKITPLNKLAVVPARTNKIYTWFSEVMTDNQYVSATNGNNYTVVPGMTLGFGHARGLDSYFINQETFDLVLPKGISYGGQLDDVTKDFWQLVHTVSEADGKTRLSFKSTHPFYYTWGARIFHPKLKVDRKVITGTGATVWMENYRANVRNYDKTDLTDPKIKSKLYYFDIFELSKDQDNIAAFGTSPGMRRDSNVNFVDSLASSQKRYVSLGAFPYDTELRNFNDTNSRKKEIRYVFPKNENVEVKGFFVWSVDGKMPSKIKVASRNSPTLREVTLNNVFKPNKPNFVDVLDLGLKEDDVLTEVVYPIGVIKPGNNSITGKLYPSSQANIFGLVKKFPDQPTLLRTAEVTVRDEGYDPKSPSNNQVVGTGYFNLYLAGPEAMCVLFHLKQQRSHLEKLNV